MKPPLNLGLSGEDHEQASVIRWAYSLEKQHPELALLFHVPNGGWRGVVAGMRMKALGVKRGVPDLFLAVVRYFPDECRTGHGLWIEMKTAKGVFSSEQKAMHAALEKQSYAVHVARSAAEAQQIICDYLGISGK